MRTHLDLCSGIGGFSLAAESCGVRTIGFAEIAPFASAVLAERWPGIPNFGDVRNVPKMRPWLVTAGFPCQPYSKRGKRKGGADGRCLWREIVAVVSRCRPAWLLGENVPDFASMGLDEMLSELEGHGYACRPFIIPACAVDAWHQRDRLWIVAHAPGRRLKRSEQGSIEAAATPRLHRGERWPAESGLVRVVHGLPGRTLRVAALGNAIVPQVASEIISLMIESESHLKPINE